MTSTAILLVSLSAIIHASWNLISKHQRPTTSFFLCATIYSSILFMPFALINFSVLPIFLNDRVWLILIFTGFSMAVYFGSLAGAYRYGNITIAYPLARSSPVLVVMAVTWLLGQGEAVSLNCVAGILLVVSGCFLIPLREFKDFHLSAYLQPVCGLAFLAALGTTGYSILDAEAIKIINSKSDLSLSKLEITLIYSFFESVFAMLFMSIWLVLRKSERDSFKYTFVSKKLATFLTGLFIPLTYLFILLSLNYVNNVSYVVGLRQLSIPLVAIMGVILLKEELNKPKIIGSAVIFFGLLLIAF